MIPALKAIVAHYYDATEYSTTLGRLTEKEARSANPIPRQIRDRSRYQTRRVVSREVRNQRQVIEGICEWQRQPDLDG